MPLRCQNQVTGEDIQAFDLNAGDWRALADENRSIRHLRLPCCSSMVTLKTSRRGTQFFAHKAKGTCSTAPETEAHLRLKEMTVAAARANGWEAATEVAGSTPDGESWIADILARRGGHRIAVEIQWSPQTDGETLSRQRRYGRSGVRGLWLLRQRGFPITHELPAARIKTEPDKGYLACVPTGWHTQDIPMEEFLHAAFSGCLKFGMPEGFAADVSVRANDTECWKCHERTRVISSIAVEYGPHSCEFSIPDLTDYQQVFSKIQEHLPDDPTIGRIKHRYSRTQERSYLSNGCVRCDVLFGEYHEIEHRYNEWTICEFVTPVTRPWLAAIEMGSGGDAAWGVYHRLK